MRDNPINWLRLWLHCLVHWHRSAFTSGGHSPTIGCYDCDYGQKKYEKTIKWRNERWNTE